MTQPVPTDGFNVPGTTPGGAAPPANAQPGFVPPQPAPAAPAPAAAPTGDVAALTAALTAALAAQNAAPAPAATPAVPAQIEASGDPILDSMAAVLQTAVPGVDLDRLLGKAVEYGDANLIDLAYLQEKGGANSAQLLRIAQGIVQTVNAKTAAVTGEVHALAGSEANWNACAAAFNQKADPALKAVTKQMLDSKNNEQIKAAAKLIVDFAKGTGIVPTQAGLVQNVGAVPVSGQGLSKDEFQAELRKLNPQDRGFVAAREQLYARRAMGKQLGR